MAHVYGWMDQGATWYGGIIVLGPDHIVLDGDPAPPQKGAHHPLPPLFASCLLWSNGRPSQQLLSSWLLWRCCQTYYAVSTKLCQAYFRDNFLKATMT